MNLHLTDEEADALYRCLEDNDLPEVLAMPLANVLKQLSDWHRFEAPM